MISPYLNWWICPFRLNCNSWIQRLPPMTLHADLSGSSRRIRLVLSVTLWVEFIDGKAGVITGITSKKPKMPASRGGKCVVFCGWECSKMMGKWWENDGKVLGTLDWFLREQGFTGNPFKNLMVKNHGSRIFPGNQSKVFSPKRMWSFKKSSCISRFGDLDWWGKLMETTCLPWKNEPNGASFSWNQF